MTNTSNFSEFQDQNPLESNGFDFWALFRILQKWFWLVLLIITIVMSLAVLKLVRTTPIYRASAVLEVKQEERNIIEVSEVENIIADKEFLSTQVELLKSDSLVRDVVEALNLVSDTNFYDPTDEDWLNLPREERIRSVIAEVKNKITVTPIGRSRLINVSFEHSSPRQAAFIANTLTETFINNTLARKFNATAYARDFLENRLQTVKASLEEAEEELVQYASDNNLLVLNNEDGREVTSSLDASSLIQLDAELTTAITERVAAEIAYKQVEEGRFLTEIMKDQTISQLKSARVELNSEYIEKLAVYKPDFPEMLELKSRIDLFDKTIEEETQAIVGGRKDELQAAYDLALAKERDLTQRVANLKSSVIDIREKSINYTILKRQVDTERTQYDALLQRLKEVSVSDNIGSNLVQIVDAATPPQLPFSPQKARTLILAFLLSSLLGGGLVYLIEIIDDRVKGPDDVKNKVKQIIMGVIPAVEVEDDIFDSLQDPQSAISEAYASLRTNLQFSGPNGGPKVIQMTSTRSGEGKSVSSLSLAMKFAGLGKRVLLIDADMRLPTFLKGKGQTVGLSGILTSDVNFADQIQQSNFENLDLLPSGHSVPNPSEILSTGRLDELIEYARQNYTHVLVDSPPVLGLADAPTLGAKVDATLLIVESRKIRTPNVKASIERLQASGTRLLGVVLTKYKTGSNGYGDYYKYSYGTSASTYGQNSKKDATPGKSKRKFKIA
ncbi:capsular exopolysaccharide synthesis family protein [Litorimonas taeanensis]|uniref:non-specific protein-tyrosine kinase n=1 Tax=Litorimonas taeanensis TaxID=568099 RepID=A0A420WDW5_9PROT|nr:polysaccharide biosynthesis tyrosine autokinase [Litorimonas taeanensis]RKQ69082.1 capsular exopolysaccharide synthesis family protein [Litorimonas taeanensis]